MQRKVTGPGVTDPTCHAERQYRSPPLLYHLGRDIGEYYPIVNTVTEYREVPRESDDGDDDSGSLLGVAVLASISHVQSHV